MGNSNNNKIHLIIFKITLIDRNNNNIVKTLILIKRIEIALV